MYIVCTKYSILFICFIQLFLYLTCSFFTWLLENLPWPCNFIFCIFPFSLWWTPFPIVCKHSVTAYLHSQLPVCGSAYLVTSYLTTLLMSLAPSLPFIPSIPCLLSELMVSALVYSIFCLHFLTWNVHFPSTLLLYLIICLPYFTYIDRFFLFPSFPLILVFLLAICLPPPMFFLSLLSSIYLCYLIDLSYISP